MTLLLDYQRKGVDAIHRFDGRCLLADQMGLGKSFEVLKYLQESDAKLTIVICPKAAKLHWEREARQHVGMRSLILSGTTPYRFNPGKARLIILNYDILFAWWGQLKKLQPDVIVADECHMISNLRTKRTKALRRLCSGIRHIIGVSGTPMTNRPFEMFSILNILCPEEFPSPFGFGHAYCNAMRIMGHWVFNGARNLKELHQRLRKLCMIRRTKQEVLSELPPKRRSVITLEIKNRKEYESAEEDIVSWLAKTDLAAAARAAKAERMQRFVRLKRLSASLKIKSVMEWIDDYLAESDGKLLFGYIHKDFGAQLLAKYKKVSVMIDGDKTEKQRQQAEDSYRLDSKFRILFGQIQAAGVCLNLPETDTVAIGEMPWTPGACQQFEDRACRLTTKHSVHCCYLIAKGTVEEEICELLDRKQTILDKTIDGVSSQESSLTIFDLLQERLLKRKHR